MEFEVLRDSLVKILGVAPDEVTMQSSFSQDLGADSLDLYQVLLNAKEVFDLEIDTEKLQSLETVSQAVAYMKEMKRK
ncbi:MAG: acyl carrier protein [Lachnospiraceae bacterium]|nr:acyl carrier protein [Lachnospiraceae bacterium]MDD5854058.1 acyl carrier protein [Lachnospiraceae bacterium]